MDQAKKVEYFSVESLHCHATWCEHSGSKNALITKLEEIKDNESKEESKFVLLKFKRVIDSACYYAAKRGCEVMTIDATNMPEIIHKAAKQAGFKLCKSITNEKIFRKLI